ncbi:DNA topoisomerase VI, B subunit [Anaeromyxobacter dehalogenans 2CP-1]|uniref:Type 2 DNA topoisomerase 6 subunit B n=1 Tax=Anaeromyxobacter dehalogenans (strain ATCC BAA-258 / DSM 21875 / 2CP-1) TaxID=455488 RepID=B8JFI2_ANAD2|nr:DNA topoisomerase VI subunit B [Anaeromyxobacter dehalogenans]ACL66359.1 DNA topoisomerase VI, B subunit [Anaeromyxobacter dehalogenans 2CP-1]
MAARKAAAVRAKGKATGRDRERDQLELAVVGGPAPRRSKGAATPPPRAPARKPAGRARPAPVEEPELLPPAPEAEPEAAPAARSPKRRATAEQMAQQQREISISEFFTKNRHLLGFDNASKALLTTIKEAVDNSLDACEEAGILPEITIEVRDLGLNEQGEGELTKGEGRFVVVVEDNGPGIVKAQAPKIFGKLLYGSKFHRLKQSRGQQGIGISAAAMYGQLTTGQPIRMISRTGKGKPAFGLEIQIDTRKNNPVVTAERQLDDWHEHGTRVELEIVANWQQGQRFVNRYVEHTALSNPHAAFHYLRPRQPPLSFPRATDELPKEAQEIKPHPHGVELGALMRMAADSKSHDVRGFLQAAFSRVSSTVADEIVKKAGFKARVRPRDVAADREVARKLHQAIGATKIMAPPTQILSPIGDTLMRKGLVSFLNVIETEGPEEEEQLDLDAARKKKATRKGKAAKAEAPEVPDAPPEEGVEKIKGHNYFIATVTRPPKVYRGNPFQVEVGLAYGGSWPADKPIELFRFANRVPLLFQRGACGMTEAIVKTDWRNYLLSQPRGSLPVGPMALLVHIASVWVPFTSEAKEAVAHYPEITREIQLAAQECGRKLAAHIRKRKHADYQAQRRSLFELYIQEVAQAIGKIVKRSPDPIKREFLRLADQVTEQEGAGDGLDDAALEEQSRKITRRPRRAEEEEQG